MLNAPLIHYFAASLNLSLRTVSLLANSLRLNLRSLRDFECHFGRRFPFLFLFLSVSLIESSFLSL